MSHHTWETEPSNSAPHRVHGLGEAELTESSVLWVRAKRCVLTEGCPSLPPGRRKVPCKDKLCEVSVLGAPSGARRRPRHRLSAEQGAAQGLSFHPKDTAAHTAGQRLSEVCFH